MSRRQIENLRMRRTAKKHKAMVNSFADDMIYVKLLFVWALVIAADHLLRVRLEYLWTFWVVLRSIYDSCRYQGVVHSVFYLLLTVVWDVVCFVFIPVQWLFLLAGAFVWVHYIWHMTDRGICLPTAVLCVLFMYMEAAVRLKELNSMSITLDLCRPFASNCVGYPMVTGSFGLKNYVSYRIRLGRQREVARMNRVHRRVLAEALPAIRESRDTLRQRINSLSSEQAISNGAMCSANRVITRGHVDQTASAPFAEEADSVNSPRVSGLPPKKLSDPIACGAASSCNRRIDGALDFCQTQDGDVLSGMDRDADEIECVSTLSMLRTVKAKLFGSTAPVLTSSNFRDFGDDDRKRDSQTWIAFPKRQSFSKRKSKRAANKCRTEDGKEGPLSSVSFARDPNAAPPVQEDKEKVQDKYLYVNFELDIDKLKSELTSSRTREQELRSHVQRMVTAETSTKKELEQLHQINEQLQIQMQNLVRSRQKDKETMAMIGNKLAEEEKLKLKCERMLEKERKQRSAQVLSASGCVTARNECTQFCNPRRLQLESQLKQLRDELEKREQRLLSLESEIKALRAFKEQNNANVLMTALTTMQEMNAHLENALSAETRIKLDLFSALGDAKRQLQLLQDKVVNADKETDCIHRQLIHDAAVCNCTVSSSPTAAFPLTPPQSAGATSFFFEPAACTALHGSGDPGIFNATAAMAGRGSTSPWAGAEGHPQGTLPPQSERN